MAVDTVTGAALTQEQVQRILVRPLEEASTFLASGPRIFDSNGSQVRVPKLPNRTAPGFVAENELIPDVSPEFQEINLLPSNMKSVKTLVRFSNEMARQSVVALDAALRQRLVSDVALTIDDELYNGDGTADANGNVAPTGLLNYAGTQELPVGAAVTLDDLHDAVGLALAANVSPQSSMWWNMNSRDFVAIRKLKDSYGRYQVEPDPTQQGVYRLLGFPVTITNVLPVDQGTSANASTIVLADWSQVAVARDLAPSVTVLSERYADYDQQALRVVSRYDAAPMNAEAVVLLTGVTVA